jgi:hypothetical protein
MLPQCRLPPDQMQCPGGLIEFKSLISPRASARHCGENEVYLYAQKN